MNNRVLTGMCGNFGVGGKGFFCKEGHRIDIECWYYKKCVDYISVYQIWFEMWETV